MLILSRKPYEKLIIGNNVSITILDIEDSQVRIGIDAPQEISVYRENIIQKTKREVKHKKIFYMLCKKILQGYRYCINSRRQN